MSLTWHMLVNMDAQTVQGFIVTATGFAFALCVYALAKRERLSFRYAVGWLFIFCSLIFGPVLIHINESIAERFQLSTVSIIVWLSVSLLIGLCIQLSVSCSGAQRQLRRLNEEFAFQSKILEDLRDSKK
jgi:hypothetical protein